jgi:phosphoglycolate phosphatase
MQTILWDWNGTLLNDLSFCITTINTLLEKRNLELLTTESYKEKFSFPVKDYYSTIGFDFQKEDFAIPAQEFIDIYNSGINNCKLHHSVKSTLEFFKENEFRQFVLSAMEQSMLKETLTQQNIISYFENIAGLSDHYAASKVERGKQLLHDANIDPQTTTMIGDTIHDFEVAQELGINSILVAAGHQSMERLRSTGTVVINDLEELKKVIYSHKEA